MNEEDRRLITELKSRGYIEYYDQYPDNEILYQKEYEPGKYINIQYWPNEPRLTSAFEVGMSFASDEVTGEWCHIKFYGVSVEDLLERLDISIDKLLRIRDELGKEI